MSAKINVLFLCGWYPSRVLPTNGDFIQRHAEAVSLIHNVSVLHIISDEKNIKDIEISTKVINGIETHIAYLKAVKNPLKKTYLYIKAFHLLIKKVDNFDVVHLNQLFPFGVFSLYLKWFQKKQYIISEHFTGYLSASKFKINFFQKIITKCIVKNAYAVCPVSDYLSINMIELGFKGNYKTVPNVVNTNLFIPSKKESGFLKIVHISSLKDNHKNIKGMLRVAKLLSEKLTYFEWKFIGNIGDEYKEYLNKFNFKNCKISFLEHISHSEIVSNLQEASLCISFSNYETFGIVITEAIACGTPVISTNTGIATSLKNLDFCKVIPVKNEQLLLESILNYKTFFANLDSYKMHLFVKKLFSKDVIANEFSSLYYKLLKE